MAFQGSYKCSSCGNTESRDKLVAKKVMFQELGERPKTIKSRTTAWLCVRCLVQDPDWKRERYQSPGLASVE